MYTHTCITTHIATFTFIAAYINIHTLMQGEIVMP